MKLLNVYCDCHARYDVVNHDHNLDCSACRVIGYNHSGVQCDGYSFYDHSFYNMKYSDSRNTVDNDDDRSKLG